MSYDETADRVGLSPSASRLRTYNLTREFRLENYKAAGGLARRSPTEGPNGLCSLYMLSPLRHARACSPPLRQRTYQGSKSTLSTCKFTLSLSLYSYVSSILDPVH